METWIYSLGGNLATLSVVVVFIWKRTEDIKRSIDRLWVAFDTHRLDRDIHIDAERVARIERFLNGKLQRFEGGKR